MAYRYGKAARPRSQLTIGSVLVLLCLFSSQRVYSLLACSAVRVPVNPTLRVSDKHGRFVRKCYAGW
jgi:hypothetical protein